MRKRALRKTTALALVVGIATVARGTTIPVDSTADSLAVDGKITVKGAGGNLDMPALPLAAPVRVQLVRLGAGPTCWEATFSTSTRNDAEVFRARSDP